MPTYHALNTRLDLRVSNLGISTTSEPTKSKDAESTNLAKQCQEFIENGRVLTERAVSLNGDDEKLHFFGPQQSIPFFMVRTGEELFTATDASRLKNTKRLRSSGRQSLSMDTSSNTQDSPDQSIVSTPTNITTPMTTMMIPLNQPNQAFGNTRTRSKGPVEPLDLSKADSKTPSHHPSPISASSPISPFPGQDGIDSEAGLSPYALGIVISMSKKTFLSNIGETSRQAVRYDVFFNGELCESNFIPVRAAPPNTSASKTSRHSTVVTSGKRIDHQIERPWVVTRPGLDARGEIVGRKLSKRSNPKHRWLQIGASIKSYADSMMNHGDQSNSPLAEYLTELAAIDLPKELEGLPMHGGHKFGVIDVVLSAGIGHRSSLGKRYLTHPELLEIQNVPAALESQDLHSQKRQKTSFEPTSKKLNDSMDIDDSQVMSEISNPDVSMTYYASIPRRRWTRGIPKHLKKELPSSGKPSRWKLLTQTLPVETPSKARSSHDNPMGTGQSALEELKVGTSEAQNKVYSSYNKQNTQNISGASRGRWLNLPNDVTPASSTDIESLAYGDQTPSRRLGDIGQSSIAEPAGDQKKSFRIEGVVFKIDGRAFLNKKLSKPLELKLNQQSPLATSGLSEKTLDTPLQGPAASSIATLKPQEHGHNTSVVRQRTIPKRHRQGNGSWEYAAPTYSDVLNHKWETPELSKDCILTYAESGPWQKEAGAGGYSRLVRRAQNGSFKETDVILGARFVIG